MEGLEALVKQLRAEGLREAGSLRAAEEKARMEEADSAKEKARAAEEKARMEADKRMFLANMVGVSNGCSATESSLVFPQWGSPA